jgi:hypothetical protein
VQAFSTFTPDNTLTVNATSARSTLVCVVCICRSSRFLRIVADLVDVNQSPGWSGRRSLLLVSEVHPFADGNGRVARIMMNAELVAAGQERIIIPTSYRTDYLGALKALSHNAHMIPLIRMLDYAQQYTH